MPVDDDYVDFSEDVQEDVQHSDSPRNDESSAVDHNGEHGNENDNKGDYEEKSGAKKRSRDAEAGEVDDDQAGDRATRQVKLRALPTDRSRAATAEFPRKSRFESNNLKEKEEQEIERIPNILFVTRYGHTKTIYEADLDALFRPFGEIERVTMKGAISFVDFVHADDAAKAKKELHQTAALFSDSIIVDFKKVGTGHEDKRRTSYDDSRPPYRGPPRDGPADRDSRFGNKDRDYPPPPRYKDDSRGRDYRDQGPPPFEPRRDSNRDGYGYGGPPPVAKGVLPPPPSDYDDRRGRFHSGPGPDRIDRHGEAPRDHRPYDSRPPDRDYPPQMHRDRGPVSKDYPPQQYPPAAKPYARESYPPLDDGPDYRYASGGGRADVHRGGGGRGPPSRGPPHDAGDAYYRRDPSPPRPRGGAPPAGPPYSAQYDRPPPARPEAPMAGGGYEGRGGRGGGGGGARGYHSQNYENYPGNGGGGGGGYKGNYDDGRKSGNGFHQYSTGGYRSHHQEEQSYDYRGGNEASRGGAPASRPGNFRH